MIENILSRIGLKRNKTILSHIDCVASLSDDNSHCELQELPDSHTQVQCNCKSHINRKINYF